jgi:hypothetical protein
MKIIFIVFVFILAGCSQENSEVTKSISTTPWDVVADCEGDSNRPYCTYRMKVPGGWLYYMFQYHNSAAVFVPEIPVVESGRTELSPGYVHQKMSEVKQNVCP